MNRRIDSVADLLLPALLIPAAAASVAAVVEALRAHAGLVALPAPWLVCLLFGVESYLFTTAFALRTFDAPATLRWVEVAFALLTAVFLAGLPVHGWARALTGEPHLSVITMVLAYAACWYLGLKLAHLAGALHPGAPPDPDADLDRSDRHGQALRQLTSLLMSLTVTVAMALSLIEWVAGRAGPWRWSGPAAYLLLGAALSLAALAVGGYLQRQMTWAQDGLAVDPVTLRRWVPGALTLSAIPLLAALLLPAGWARVPIERLLPVWAESSTQSATPAQQADPSGPDVVGLLRSMGDTAQETTWWLVLIQALARVGIGLVVLGLGALLLALLYTAIDRDLRGGWVRQFLAVLAEWLGLLWAGLREALRGLQRAGGRAATAATAELVSETGLLGRLLPAGMRPIPTDPREAVRYCYRRLLAAAARRGWRPPPGATAAEVARMLAGAAPAEAEAVERLTALYDEARYGPAPVKPTAASYVRRVWVSVARSLRRRT